MDKENSNVGADLGFYLLQQKENVRVFFDDVGIGSTMVRTREFISYVLLKHIISQVAAAATHHYLRSFIRDEDGNILQATFLGIENSKEFLGVFQKVF